MRRKPSVSTSVQLGPSLSEQVTEMLRAQIASGTYAEGASLPSEHKLSLEFGVSRAVIREALSRLKADKLERTLEDRKIVDRAKGRLMDTLHLSESEAHYRIQKQSMDSGRRIADVAREILESAEIAAS